MTTTHQVTINFTILIVGGVFGSKWTSDCDLSLFNKICIIFVDGLKLWLCEGVCEIRVVFFVTLW